MALTYRFYRSPQIGDGSSPHNAKRSALTQYIVNDGSGADFWDWINDAKPVRYALALCESSVHTTIDVDATITAISDELADLGEVRNWLGQTALSLSAGVQSVIEGDGLSLAWLAQQTTRKQMLNYISRQHVVIQDLKRLKNSDSLVLFSTALNTQVRNVPVANRTKVGDWIEGKGLDKSWITLNTTVRQVVQYVMENIQWPVLPLGPLDL